MTHRRARTCQDQWTTNLCYPLRGLRYPATRGGSRAIRPPSRATHTPADTDHQAHKGRLGLFAAAISGDGAGPSDVPRVPAQPPGKLQPPSRPPPSGPPLPSGGPHRWAPPQYPPPPGPPDPPAPWVLDAANLGPWASL